MVSTKGILAFIGLIILPDFTLACLPGMTPHSHARRSEPAEIQNRDQPPLPSGITALKNVRVFDGYKIHRPGTVVFNGTTIIDSHFETEADKVIDGKRGVLLPGLIESHAHPESIQHLEMLASWGVTTVMNMACHNYNLCDSLKGQIGLTDFKTAGNPAQGPGSQHAVEQGTPRNKLIWKPEQASDFVANVFNNGSDYLKITSEKSGPDQATQNALVSNAHFLGKKVMTHAAAYKFYQMAIESGSNGPQHIPYDQVLSDEDLDTMLEKGMFATPTVNLYRLLLPSIGSWEPDFKGVNYTKGYNIVQENVRRLHEHGTPVLAGTDSSMGGYYPVSLPFGQCLHEELHNFVNASIGFTAAETLRAATIVPAEQHDLNDRGRIAPGLRADLLLLEPGADPLKDVRDAKKIARVWTAGVEYKGELKIKGNLTTS